MLHLQQHMHAHKQNRSKCCELKSEYVVVKPACEESSIGIFLTPNDPVSLGVKCNELLSTIEGPILVQEYIQGNDITIPMVGREEASCLPAVVLTHEKQSPELFIFDAATKARKEQVFYDDALKLGRKIVEKAYNMALASWQLGQLRDYARMDCRVTPSGELYFLEINANPQLGLGKASISVSANLIDLCLGQVVQFMMQKKGLPHGTKPMP